MKSLIESAATRAGVPVEVLDLVGRDFISETIEELPNLLLPPIMRTLKEHYLTKGLAWIEQNVSCLRNHFIVLKQMYGPAGSDDLEKPMYHLVLP
jgi:hypothetical protein